MSVYVGARSGLKGKPVPGLTLPTFITALSYQSINCGESCKHVIHHLVSVATKARSKILSINNVEIFLADRITSTVDQTGEETMCHNYDANSRLVKR